MLMQCKAAYDKGGDFKEYVDKYYRSRRLLYPEDSFKHIVVQEYLKMLKAEGRA